MIDFDGSWWRSRFADVDPVGQWVPQAVGAVFLVAVRSKIYIAGMQAFAGDNFGPRALVEDDSVRSAATSLLNLQGGYRFRKTLRLNLEIFNLLEDSDLDYFDVPCLPREPLNDIADIHSHGTIQRYSVD